MTFTKAVTFAKAMTNTVAGSMQTMVMQTKLQYFRIVATSASPSTSLQHSGWKATSVLEHGMLQAASSAGSFLMDAELIIALTLSGMLKRILLPYPGNTTHILQLLSVYLHPFKKPTVQQPKPKRSLALPERTSKQPGVQLACTLPALTLCCTTSSKTGIEKKQWKTCLAPSG